MAGHHTSRSGDREPVIRETSTYMTDQESEQFCALFADGLDTGTGYARILAMLERQNLDKALLTNLSTALLERGDLLGEAFARYGMLDPSARKLILVAEEQGKLPQTFRQLGRIYGKRHKRIKDFVYGMVEPALIVMLGLIVARNLFSSNLTAIAMSSNTWDQLGDVFVKAGIEAAIFALACVSCSFFLLNMPVDFAPRAMFHRLMLRLPFVGEPGKLFAISLFCMYLRQSLTSGLSAYKGLELAAEASNSPALLDRLPRAQERILEGASLSSALFSVKALPDDVIEGIDIGEETGRLDERLAWLAERYEHNAQEAFQRFLSSTTYLMRFGIIIVVIISVMFSVLTGNSLEL